MISSLRSQAISISLNVIASIWADCISLVRVPVPIRPAQAIVQDLLDLRDKRNYGRRESKKAKLNNKKQGTYYIRGNCDVLRDLIEERIDERRFLSKRISLKQLIDHRKDIDFIATYED